MPRNRKNKHLSDLEAQVIRILKQNPEKGDKTRANRSRELEKAARQLHEQFHLRKVQNIRPKHLDALIGEWRGRGNGIREMQNKMSHVRWLLRKVGKSRMAGVKNAELGIGGAKRYTRAGKFIPEEQFERILAKLSNPKDRLMVMMGRHFGMRFREAALFRPNRDVQGNQVWIKRGTKGKKPRYNYIVNDEQRKLLETLRQLIRTRDGNLVTAGALFHSWTRSTYKRLNKAGLSQSKGEVFHDLRRTWADHEFNRLISKGVSRAEAAHMVSKRLGHNREEVLKWYLPEAA